MATPSKVAKLEDSDNVVSGYAHNVSPIKVSSNNIKYFTCVFKNSRDDFHRGVVFSPEKHDTLDQAAVHKTAVKLRNVKTLNFNGSQYRNDKYNVLVNRQTTILVTDLNFPNKKPYDSQKMTLKQVIALQPYHGVGEVHVKVMNLEVSTEMRVVYGAEMEVCAWYVADETSKMKLLLYDSQVKALKTGKSYRITNLSTRNMATLYMTCTKATVFEEISNVNVPASVAAIHVEEPQDNLMTITGNITCVKLDENRQCVRCSRKQPTFNTKLKFHRCDKCHFLQKVDTYTTSISGTVVLKSELDEESTVTLPPSVLRTYMEQLNQDDHLQDAEDVEQHIIDTSAFTITMNTSYLATSLTRHTEHTNQKGHGTNEAITSSSATDEQDTSASKQNNMMDAEGIFG